MSKFPPSLTMAPGRDAVRLVNHDAAEAALLMEIREEGVRTCYEERMVDSAHADAVSFSETCTQYSAIHWSPRCWTEGDGREPNSMPRGTHAPCCPWVPHPVAQGGEGSFEPLALDQLLRSDVEQLQAGVWFGQLHEDRLVVGGERSFTVSRGKAKGSPCLGTTAS